MQWIMEHLARPSDQPLTRHVRDHPQGAKENVAMTKEHVEALQHMINGITGRTPGSSLYSAIKGRTRF